MDFQGEMAQSTTASKRPYVNCDSGDKCQCVEQCKGNDLCIGDCCD